MISVPCYFLHVHIWLNWSHHKALYFRNNSTRRKGNICGIPVRIDSNYAWFVMHITLTKYSHEYSTVRQHPWWRKCSGNNRQTVYRYRKEFRIHKQLVGVHSPAKHVSKNRTLPEGKKCTCFIVHCTYCSCIFTIDYFVRWLHAYTVAAYLLFKFLKLSDSSSDHLINSFALSDKLSPFSVPTYYSLHIYMHLIILSPKRGILFVQIQFC